MSGSMSDYLELKVLDHVTGKTAYSMPTVYVVLCTADPTDAGTGASCNEVPHSGSYERVATAGSDWNAAAGGSASNATVLQFPTATGSWGTATYFALFDSGTYGAGNMLWHGSVTTPKTVSTNDAPQFAAGSLVLSQD